MRVYVAHSKKMDYENKLYKPLRNDKFFDNYEIILPHEEGYNNKHTRDFYRGIDIFIADVTESGTGLGIELGWVYDDNKKIYCIYA